MTSNRDKDKDNATTKAIPARVALLQSINKQREIASKGGKAAHERGTAHESDWMKRARPAGTGVKLSAGIGTHVRHRSQGR